MPDPHHHRCDVKDIDYSTAIDGMLECKVCERIWTFIPKRGWFPNPVSRYPPRR